jgi:cob(I)alamin adenosyltransferase
MVVLSKIYTRTGDDGTTALGSGRRVAKYDLRVEVYGTLDETNAAIGLARLHTRASDPALDAMLERIQNDLFDLGAELCYPDETKDARGRLAVTDGQVERLEHEIDALNRELEPLRSFVLPGGSPAASFLHLARTVSRRGRASRSGGRRCVISTGCRISCSWRRVLPTIPESPMCFGSGVRTGNQARVPQCSFPSTTPIP